MRIWRWAGWHRRDYTIITSKHNEKIKKYAKLKKSNKKSEYFIAEGLRTIINILNNGREIIDIFITQDFLNKNSDISKIFNNITISIVDEQTLDKLVDSVNPQGIVGISKVPTYDIEETILTPYTKIAYLNGVNDPGNIGTIIRTACAFNFHAIVYDKKTVYPYSSKVTRASLGSNCIIPMYYDEDNSMLDLFRKHEYTLYFTDLLGENINKTVFSQNSVIILGNEANGIDKELINEADKKISIDMNYKFDSLNVSVAFGIIAHKLF